MTSDEQSASPRHARHRQPPPLRPPGATIQGPVAGPSSRTRLWLTLAVLIALGGGVVLVLPGLLDSSRTPAPPTGSPVPAGASQSTPAEAGARLQAEQTLQQFLRLQAELTLLRAPEWATAQWTSAAQQAVQGDRLFGERRFSEAGQSYARAAAGLEAVKAGRSARLAELLTAGAKALDNDAGETALSYFEQALLIDATSDEAQTGLARARVRAGVLGFMATAVAAEAARQWQAARAAYRQALDLDAVFAPARQGLARVEAVLDAEAFDAAMSEALAALGAGRFDAAGAALDKAAAIDAEAVALTDTRERLRLARQQAAVDGLRRAAAARVEAEDWQGATERYQRVLQIDAAAGFAREGIARAEQRARLNRQFDHYLDQPSRLYSAEPLANAEQLLNATRDVPQEEPKLRSKLQRLQTLVRQARQPLPVTLRSDGETEVVIYHVGRLGRFADRQLQLLPGTYTAVGSRAGYRDVRRVFELLPGQSSVTIDIRCEETV